MYRKKPRIRSSEFRRHIIESKSVRPRTRERLAIKPKKIGRHFSANGYRRIFKLSQRAEYSLPRGMRARRSILSF
jgi:hypothetical protein